MKATPAFQFYPADFLIGIADMTHEEAGIYIRLLCLQWAKGRLDTSKTKLLVGTEIPPAVMEKFLVADGRMWNVRLEDEREKQAKYREEQSKKGKAGADARWNGNGHAPANGQTMAENNSRPSPGQSQNDGSSPVSSSSSLSVASDLCLQESQTVPGRTMTTGPKEKVGKKPCDSLPDWPELQEFVGRSIDPFPHSEIPECFHGLKAFEPLKAEHLQDSVALREWHRWQLTLSSPVLGATEAHARLMLATALHVLRIPKDRIKKARVAMFVDIISKQRWGDVRERLALVQP